MTTLPFENAFIDDESARDFEEHERPYEFLITGRAPVVGQRMQSYLEVPNTNGAWCRFSGIVTDVDEEPTMVEWVSTSFWTEPFQSNNGNYSLDRAFRFENDCTECGTEPSCWGCMITGGKKSTILTLPVLKDRCKATMGALHNQKITMYAYLKFYGDPVATLPYTVGRIYKICFKLDDSKVIPWCVISLHDVTDSTAIKDLPQVFKDWEQGREQGMVAPFDLPAKEREKYALDTQQLLAHLKEEQGGMNAEWDDE